MIGISFLCLQQIKDMSKPKEVLNNVKLPSCFDCERREVENNCNYFEILKYAKKLEIKYKTNFIDQNNLKNLFLDFFHQ